MATTLRFDSEEALRVALTSGLVPEKLQAEPAALRRDPEGCLLVTPSKSVPKRTLAALKKAGVDACKPPKLRAREVCCWAELITPAFVGDGEVAPMVLFRSTSRTPLLSLAAELLRLGCDRQSFCFGDSDGGFLLRAVDPPFYSLVRALDDGGLRAYVPAPLGQEKTWISFGYAHPLEDRLDASRKSMLLIEPDGTFRPVANKDWTDLYELLEVPVPPAQRPKVTAQASRLKVTLRLVRDARETLPGFWMLQGDGAVDAVDRLVQHLPQTEMARLLFAAVGDPKQPTVLLKTRPGQAAVIEAPGDAYSTYRQIGNLYLPADARLEPPLRRPYLRQLVAGDPDEVVWLVPISKTDGNGEFTAHRVAEADFAPLSEWVEYLVSAEADALDSWVRAVTFDFEPFESIGVEWAEQPQPEPEQKEKSKKQRRKRPAQIAEPEELPSVQIHKAVARETVDLAPAPEMPDEPEEAERIASELESVFVTSDAAADASERTALWKRLAPLYQQLERFRDAQLCWTRAVWEEDLGGIASLDHKLDAANLAKLDANKVPSSALLRRMVRELVVFDLQGGVLESTTQHRVQVFFDAHDGALDVRSLWLARLALSRMAGGDRLQLVQTRDRILDSLHRGLSVQRDVPSFVRFWGTTQLGDNNGAGVTSGTLARRLEQLQERLGKARRQRSAVEAPEELTRAYLHLLLAFGFARVGQADRARQLRNEGRAALDDQDPIHGFLGAAYSERVEHALEGLPLETPLTPDLSARLNDLDTFSRYKVDRLRQASTILEPQERLDPVRAFARGDADPRGEEFAPMRGMTSQEELASAVSDVMKRACSAKTDPEDRARLFDGVMDFFPMLAEAEAVPQLRTLIDAVEDLPPPRRCEILEEALMLAGHFSRADLVTDLLPPLQELTSTLGAEHPLEVGRTLIQCLRTMRRVGRTEEATELLSRGSQAVVGDSSEALSARIQIAGGLADLGQLDAAEAVFQEGWQRLADRRIGAIDRLRITRAIALAHSYMPPDRAFGALGHLAEQLPQISDSFNTNSHFCLSVLQFAESLILGYASEQLALGEGGRRWLEEDEYLVRRRIHRDLLTLGQATDRKRR